MTTSSTSIRSDSRKDDRGRYVPRILIVEDDELCSLRLFAALSAWEMPLRNGRCIVECVPDIASARKYLAADSIDIYIIDLILSEHASTDIGSDNVGKGFTKEVAQKSNAGIIIYSSLPAETEEAVLLSEGADDYIQKIDGLNDHKQRNAVDDRIKARVLSVWRRIALTRPKLSRAFAHTNRVFLIENWRFVVGNRVLQDRDGNVIKLSQTEHAFLRYICTVEDHEIDVAIFNAEILNRQPFEHVNRIDNFIYRLRKKLGGTGQLVSIRDGRYKLVDPIELKPI